MIEHAIKICLNEERKEKDNCHFFFRFYWNYLNFIEFI